MAQYEQLALFETDQPVSREELDEIFAIRPVYNGMDDVILRERYGDRVYHLAGVGWFIRPDTSIREGVS
jgi:chromosome segregation and condensation protein ScpB